MKKVISFIVMGLALAFLTGGILALYRYTQNSEQIVPYPYKFDAKAAPLKIEAPILITGDRMGSYFARFKEELAAAISVKLEKPIKIESLAKDGNGLHRTLHELRSLVEWPQILIYQGASEEVSENKFHITEIKKILQNFKYYSDDKIETLLILYPVLSRIVYEPIKKVKLEAVPVTGPPPSEEEYLKRLDIELLLYKQQLQELVVLSRQHNTLLILTTTPLNLDVLPKRSCEFTSNMELEKEMMDLRDLLKGNDPKTAYAKSSKLVTGHSGNAGLYFIHGQIARRLGLVDEAKNALFEAGAYDCLPWRATEIHNSIIRKVARDQQVLLFDFARLVEQDFGKSETFFDEIHPQNIYYEKGMKQLGMVIKSILKL